MGDIKIAGVAYLAALDLVCSDGTTVLDPGMNGAARAGLANSTTPYPTSGRLLSKASTIFADTFTYFQAGSEVVQTDDLVACSGSYGFLGAKTERWAPGQNGSLGTQFQGAAK